MKFYNLIIILFMASYFNAESIDEALKRKSINIKSGKYYEIEEIAKQFSKLENLKIILIEIDKKETAKIRFSSEKISFYKFLYHLYDIGALIQVKFKDEIKFIIYLPERKIQIDEKNIEALEESEMKTSIKEAFEKDIKFGEPGIYTKNEIYEILSNFHKIYFGEDHLNYTFCLGEGKINFLDFLKKVSIFDPKIKLVLHFGEGKIVFQTEVSVVKGKDGISCSHSVKECMGRLYIWLDCKDYPLSDIFKSIEFAYNKNIILKDDEIKNIKISYHKEKILLDEFINEISNMLGIYFNFEEKNIIVGMK